MTDFVPDEREPKLPRWAQQLLAEERRHRALAERKLAQHLETVEPTRMWYGDYDNPIYIPKQYGHQRVHFNTAQTNGRGLYDEFQVSLKDDELEVSGGRSMTIHPQVSNVIKVRLGGW
ncbi:hypothetical protein SEA_CHARM_74 [Mycobacterium phage Charm]|nr:hypothetical protein SEA_CHARM_74 [Mycobacterium phage Charm]QGJ88351.1 hypothetical protein SEA_DREAMTEAM1_74 [Mycobacterium phage DreamTeam1]